MHGLCDTGSIYGSLINQSLQSQKFATSIYARIGEINNEDDKNRLATAVEASFAVWPCPVSFIHLGNYFGDDEWEAFID